MRSSLLVLITATIFLQNCAREDVTLKPLSEIGVWTQEELDLNRDRLLLTNQLEGDVYITDVSDLSAFQNLQSITGDLRIQYTDLENLDALANLETVNNLKIDVNPNLSLIALDKLKEVKKNITVLTNSALIAVDFPSLETVGQVNENGLQQDGALEVMNNDELLTVSLRSLKNYHGLGIHGNAKFTSLSGLTRPSDISNNSQLFRLEFNRMDCPTALFEQLDGYSSFSISVNNILESNLQWLGNTKPGTIFEFIGDFAPEDLCILKEVITDSPALLEVYENSTTLIEAFNGFAIIENCP